MLYQLKPRMIDAMLYDWKNPHKLESFVTAHVGSPDNEDVPWTAQFTPYYDAGFIFFLKHPSRIEIFDEQWLIYDLTTRSLSVMEDDQFQKMFVPVAVTTIECPTLNTTDEFALPATEWQG